MAVKQLKPNRSVSRIMQPSTMRTFSVPNEPVPYIPQVQMQTQNMDSSISFLEETLKVLEDRLHLVLRTEDGAEDEKKAAVSALVPLAAQIEGQVVRIEMITRAVQSILNRLEV